MASARLPNERTRHNRMVASAQGTLCLRQYSPAFARLGQGVGKIAAPTQVVRLSLCNTGGWAVGPVDDAQRDDDVKVRMIVKSENDAANDRDHLGLRLPRHSFT